jgi:hypothetical protein
MTIEEQKKKVNRLLDEKPVDDGVKHIKKNDGLFERKRMECSKTLITEDNKMLLND